MRAATRHNASFSKACPFEAYHFCEVALTRLDGPDCPIEPY